MHSAKSATGQNMNSHWTPKSAMAMVVVHYRLFSLKVPQSCQKCTSFRNP